MKTLILGVFKDRVSAEDAINELESSGYNPKDISIVMKDKVESTKLVDNTGANIVESASSGITSGGAIGAIAGLLIGIGAITVPGIGALLIGGPIAAALGLTGAAATTVSGAVTGALTGGLVGALVGLGLPEIEAKTYQQEIETGAIFIAVPAKKQDDNAEEILERNGASQIKKLGLKVD